MDVSEGEEALEIARRPLGGAIFEGTHQDGQVLRLINASLPIEDTGLWSNYLKYGDGRGRWEGSSG